MGVSAEIFWRSNPRTINPYLIAWEKQQFEEDRLLHRMGSYVYEAFGTALASAFSKSGVGYRDKPYLAEQEERFKIERMSEEERMERVNQIFAMLSGGNSA